MTITLKNKKLEACIKVNGAELISVKNPDGLEYIWQADPDHWKRHAPILFPVVGRLQNDEYNYNGNIYKMYQHGFARDSDFEVINANDSQAILLLKSNPEIKKIYPFNFKLFITYTLVDDTIRVNMVVKNEDEHSMYFSIGAHPGFKVPLEPEKESYTDYHVSANPAKSYGLIKLDENGLTTSNENNFDKDSNDISISHDLFSGDAKIFDLGTNNKTSFSLYSTKSKHGAEVTAYDNQYFGLWSTYPKKSDFVCIEPWWGIADSENSTGFIKDKKDISRLRCGDEFSANFDIRFF